MLKFICLMLLFTGCNSLSAQTPQEEKCNQLLSIGKVVSARIAKLEKEAAAAETETEAKIILFERGGLVQLYDHIHKTYHESCSV